jgi:type III pantothenate kinase
LKLIIDIGNSFAKVAVFDNNEIIDFQINEKVDIKLLRKVFQKFPQINSSILSSVAQHDLQLVDLMAQNGFFVELNHSTPVPFINKYRTPETLGKDRIAIASAAVQLFPNENVLVIDTGTSITYDLVTSKEEYIGGGISPGLNMRFKALHNFTHRLPLVKMQDAEAKINLVGDSTETSILSGVVVGARAEVENIINQYCSLYSSLKIIISGGDHKYFEKLLKSNIFAAPNIVVRGLNYILDFNESK